MCQPLAGILAFLGPDNVLYFSYKGVKEEITPPLSSHKCWNIRSKENMEKMASCDVYQYSIALAGLQDLSILQTPVTKCMLASSFHPIFYPKFLQYETMWASLPPASHSNIILLFLLSLFSLSLLSSALVHSSSWPSSLFFLHDIDSSRCLWLYVFFLIFTIKTLP